MSITFAILGLLVFVFIGLHGLAHLAGEITPRLRRATHDDHRREFGLAGAAFICVISFHFIRLSLEVLT